MTDERYGDQGPGGPEDERIWPELARMWEEHDPMPAGLVDQVLVALATEDLDVEYELLHLQERSRELSGARGDGEATTISFGGDSFSLLLRVSPTGPGLRRVDGWVSPAQPMRVRVAQGDHTLEAPVDPAGRFALDQVPVGLARFWLIGPAARGADEELFATPTFEI